MSNKISIVIPVFNAEDSLNELTDLIIQQIKKISNDYEIV